MSGLRLLALLWLSCAVLACRSNSSALPSVDQTRLRIEGLKAERLRLQEELRSGLSDDAKLVDAPEGAVLIGLPTTLVESIVTEALTGPLRDVRLVLKDVVKVEKTDEIRTKTFLGTMTLGHYTLTVHVQEVNAVIKPQTPQLTFGSNRIAVDLPVSVEAGAVKANLLFKWVGRKIAGIVCGDLTSEHDLRATVPPVPARLRGRFDIRARGEQLIVKPVIAPVTLAFRIEPRQRTWDFIEELIASKNAVCEAALRKAGVARKVQELVARGFKVTVPNRWVHDMVLPASFRDTFDMQGTSAGLAITPTGVSITKSRIWYGANLTLGKQPPSGRKPPRSARPE